MKKVLLPPFIVVIALIIVGITLKFAMNGHEITSDEGNTPTVLKTVNREKESIYFFKSDNPPKKNKMGIMDEMVLIPASELWIECARNDRHCVNSYKKTKIEAFDMDRYEVLLDDYMACVRAKRCSPPISMNPFWQGPWMPVAGVNWFQSVDYCRWAGKRLPTWEEWQLAARGPDGRNKYPWGNEWDPLKANWCDSIDWKEKDRMQIRTSRGNGNHIDPYTGCEGTVDGYRYAAPVNAFPDGASYYGVFNMCGNQREWTSTPIEVNENIRGEKDYVMAGGAWGPGDNDVGLPDSGLISSTRGGDPAHSCGRHMGFRCARSLSKK